MHKKFNPEFSPLLSQLLLPAGATPEGVVAKYMEARQLNGNLIWVRDPVVQVCVWWLELVSLVHSSPPINHFEQYL